ncbi:DUF2069 domain-containing protein [Paucibacter aquatile]|jgi:uncharacterized membrane protein|uniref:DUF2069 domain-containing protein n=1 Tax=Kinneretia aquatilis TaxID=2070761 RepID=A0A2N8KSY3_9BURK|nr:DUF2069 domain-containing protein [Paucibacter aquatile]
MSQPPLPSNAPQSANAPSPIELPATPIPLSPTEQRRAERAAKAAARAAKAAARAAAREAPPPPPTGRTQASPQEALSRNLALGALMALFVLCLAWELWLAPTGSGSLAIKALPLLLPMAGLWRYRLYTFRWLSLMVWLYFAEGAVRATSESGLAMWLATAEVLLSVLIFVACALQVRQRLAAAKAERSEA